MSVISLAQFEWQYCKGWDLPDRRKWNSNVDTRVVTALSKYFGARTVLEIGVNIGSTANVVLRGNAGIREYYGLDIPGTWFLSKGESAGCMVDDPRFRLMLIEGGSAAVNSSELPVMDMVFVDADHSYEGVRRDTALARSVVRPGSIIAWHDFAVPGLPGVTKFLFEENERIGDWIVHVKGTSVCYEVVFPEWAK